MAVRKKWSIILAGVAVGLVAIGLGAFGNPANMAICVACFIRDTAGALGLHRADPVQYIRPEIIGIVLGAFIIGLINKEFKPTGGSSPFTRFALGMCVMVGAMVFLGCPTRMVMRIAGGDVNAAIGLVGFVSGILTGIVFLNKGFSLKRSYEQQTVEGLGMPVVSVLLLILVIASPAFIFFSESGPGSQHAPLLISLAGGLVIGVVGQQSRLCFVGGIRDAVLFNEYRMLIAFAAILVTVLLGNVAAGTFSLGIEGQPIAHTEWIWNILGLYMVGLGSVMLGGCPLRQLVLTSGGNSDAGVTVLGFLFGAAICHNFGLSSSGAGTTANGRIGLVICIVISLSIAVLNISKKRKTTEVTA